MIIRKYIIAMLIIIVLVLSAFELNSSKQIGSFHSAKGYPNGIGIAGNTGAPGESTCASCHGASLKIGGSESTLTYKDSVNTLVTSYKPNHTYDLTFTYSISGKKGFQVVALDTNNKQAGLLTAGSNTLVTSLNSKQYLNHKSSTNSSWTFKWKAPTKNVGDVTFYVAAGNLASIYKSTYKLSAFVDTTNQGGGNNGGGNTGGNNNGSTDTTKTNAIRVNTNNFEFTAFYIAASQNLYLKYDANLKGDAFVNVLDLNGRSVAYKKVGTVNGNSVKEMELPMVVQPGTYVINMFVNNYMSSKKIVVF